MARLQGRQFDIILDSAVYHVFARGSKDKEDYVRTLGQLLKPGDTCRLPRVGSLWCPGQALHQGVNRCRLLRACGCPWLLEKGSERSTKQRLVGAFTITGNIQLPAALSPGLAASPTGQRCSWHACALAAARRRCASELPTWLTVVNVLGCRPRPLQAGASSCSCSLTSSRGTWARCASPRKTFMAATHRQAGQ